MNHVGLTLRLDCSQSAAKCKENKIKPLSLHMRLYITLTTKEKVLSTLILESNLEINSTEI